MLETENEEATSKDLMNTSQELESKCKTIGELEDGALEKAWDDVSGAELDPNQVKKAGAEEIEYVHKCNSMRRYLRQSATTRQVTVLSQ